MISSNTQSTSRRPSQPDAGLVVAIDVETTGLDPARDRIIEIAAVRFAWPRLGVPGVEDGQPVTAATFCSLVDPGVDIPPFVTSLTGITQSQVEGAPTFEEIAPRLREFIGRAPVVGHNVSFDTSFLRSHGLQVGGPAYDTQDLAFVFLPTETEHGLERLAKRLGLPHDRPHRALDDAIAARDLFMHLKRRMDGMDPAILQRLTQIGPDRAWPIALVANRVLADLPARRSQPGAGPLGIDPAGLSVRTKVAWGSRGRRDAPEATAFQAAVASVFAEGGALSQQLAGYDHRPEQERMAVAVARAIANGGYAAIEAGTGVGKSLAYLIPSAVWAASGGGTVVVSTNTINLQEQLLNKDLPLARSVLRSAGPALAAYHSLKVGDLRASQLKGRSNYLCFKKWAFGIQNPPGNEQDARVLAKCLVWLQDTQSGDRNEIGLGRDGAAFTRLSAQGAKGCPSQEGPCFLRKARAEANGADIVVINHSLLLSDVAMGGGILPEHDVLIIDEAHHLEAVATRSLGFQVMLAQIVTAISALGPGERGLVAQLSTAAQVSTRVEALSQVPAATAMAVGALGRLEERADALFSVARSFAAATRQPGEEGADLRVTQETRSDAGWEDLQTAWERFDGPLAELLSAVQALAARVEARGQIDEEVQALLMSVATPVDELSGVKNALKQMFDAPEEESVYWMETRGREWLSFNGAPLRVGPLLEEKLFKKERCVVLTGATIGGTPRNSEETPFTRYREAVGFPAGEELQLGSPFDYRKAALILVPEDIPEPGSAGYAKAVASAIEEAALALNDRMLVLFTSNSALEAARRAVAPALAKAGVRLMAQGTDGSPHRVMRSLAESQSCVAMGAASLWEGVDLNSGRAIGDSAAGVAIKALVMPRLPFPVPTEPIFAARSELYKDGFGEYAVPEAVMRFRQGFGRLIRSKADRGVFILLDRRILTKKYGLAFQKALPRCTVQRALLEDIPRLSREWIQGATSGERE